MRVSEADTRPTQLAMAASSLALGLHVAARSLREGLFLATFPVSELPKAMLGAALLAVPLALLVAHGMARFGPGRLTPILFLISACGSLGEWWLLPSLPRAMAIAVYFHVSIGGALLVSAFWSVVNECFDPHSLKVVVGRIGGASTLGGLAGGLTMERVAHSLSARSSLLLLALLALGSALLMQRLGATTLPQAKRAPEGPKARERLTGYLRTLALLVACTAAVSAFADFALKQAAAARFTNLEALVRFFAVFYTAGALGTFLVQVLVSRRLLDAIGVGRTLSVPPLVSIVLGAVSLLAPSLGTIGALRGSDLALGPSLYRSAFEPLFTPVAAASKRRSKALIDVVFDKGGETLASLLILGLLSAGPALLQRAPVALVMFTSALAVMLSLRAQRGYVSELEASLRAGTSNDSLPDLDDARRLLLSGTTLGIDRERMMEQIAHLRQAKVGPPESQRSALPVVNEPVEQIVSALRVLLGNDLKAIRDLLSGEPLDPRLAAFVIPHLGQDALAKPAVEALRAMGPAVFGVLAEAMHSTSLPAVVRRRIPHVLRNARGERVVRSLFGALSCDAIEVRYRAALALSEVTRDDSARLPRAEVYALVLHEVARGPLDRASIDHVFALLALALNRGTLELARQGVLSEDRKLRGTALEYLESLLPETVRTPLVAALAEHAGPRDVAERQPDTDALEQLRRSFRADLPAPSLGSDPD